MQAAKRPFNPRGTLFFTSHSAPPDARSSTPPALTAPGLLSERKQHGPINPAQFGQPRTQLTTARALPAHHADASLPAAK